MNFKFSVNCFKDELLKALKIQCFYGIIRKYERGEKIDE